MTIFKKVLKTHLFKLEY